MESDLPVQPVEVVQSIIKQDLDEHPGEDLEEDLEIDEFEVRSIVYNEADMMEMDRALSLYLVVVVPFFCIDLMYIFSISKMFMVTCYSFAPMLEFRASILAQYKFDVGWSVNNIIVGARWASLMICMHSLCGYEMCYEYAR